MKKPIKIPVIEKKRPPIRRYSFYFFLFSIIFSFTIFICSDSKTLTIIATSLLIISGIGELFFSTKFSTEGYLLLYSDKILIRTKSLKLDVLIKNSPKIKFKYIGYKGDHDLNPSAVTPKDGTGNFILIQDQHEEYSFELFITKNKRNVLSNTLNHWKKINPNIIILNIWGIKIKSL